MSATPFASLEDLSFPVAVVVSDADGVLDSSGEIHETFRWASVTKLLAGMATLVAVERGMVSLDDPAGPEGSTVRHLLAHASGLPFEDGAVLQSPGRRRVYSNLGIEALGDYVSEQVGGDFDVWIEETVLHPLAMSTVFVDGSPAHAATGSAADLAILSRECLAPTLIGEELFSEATSAVYPELAGVLPGFGRQDPNSWGLGFEIRGEKSPHWTGSRNSPETFGHFGQSGSFLWVDPRAGIATAFLGAQSFSSWAADLWPRLSDDILAAHAR
ncbi:serine hydrolase domain-containing protein [Bogoriella caseilytica]|uniref:CubicO group peptidase (Beta-lactamase class C family) n=1 Tax=Bogoriella caseilytica TaxID=56055 RepID=A0A3N2BBI0_9MICO|nr:serine hydrolase domain-containing protein [Bogoriella caseilytica]ROR72588.1 CubicO group peptidase (beta-lactamase class C family) [Bogoriella caseilytica]